MCIGVWSLTHPDYALILCTNRDEFLDRPTEDAHWHHFEDVNTNNNSSHETEDQYTILSGRDIQAGGSWMGINRAGRIALLTNITEPARVYPTSRGSLVSSFLLSESKHPLEDEVGKIVPKDGVYAGFNLVLFAPTVESTPGPATSTTPPTTSPSCESPIRTPTQTPTQLEPEPTWSSASVDDIYLTSSASAYTSFSSLSSESTESPPSTKPSEQSNYISYSTLLVTNHGGGGTLTSRSLSEGERICGGVSNGIDDGGDDGLGGVVGASEAQRENQRLTGRNTPAARDWPKIIHATKDLEGVLRDTNIPEADSEEEQQLTERLFEILDWRSTTTPLKHRHELRETVHVAPMRIVLEGSPITAPRYYGTRLSTVLLIRRSGETLFIERDVWKLVDGQPVYKTDPPCERRFRFKLDA